MLSDSELDELVRLALQAGAAIMDVYAREDLAPWAKSDGSPVTEADGAAEAIILAGLADSFPDIPVVAEEAMAAGVCPRASHRFFLVDPLDGTREFLSRNGDFTVNIALVEDGQPVAGVVHLPVLGEVFAGSGDQARSAKVLQGRPKTWTPIHASTPSPEGLRVVASRSHLSAETSDFIRRFTVSDLVSAGSSLKFCRVAAGDADLYPRMGPTMEWDTAAGDAVLRAAGGSVRTLDGQPLRYAKRDRPEEADFANPWFVAAGAFDPFALAAA